ncbi:unnamed protein product [Spirodela intermedia]|uniref:Tf2-1-like SH3-like domain-containing protein n=1 Tax=Spirodela intermedia TaxID=51605 RepID=A0ABN7ED37_SPIIN|nr:unnamed protein product [Spirodela intermedia]CAA6675875.1 unnamed protein product [Spirodela intermedia]CAA6675903.1 unnamed protein product [Spirodela intermedia]
MIRLNPSHLSKLYSKLQPKSFGPFKVIKKLGSSTYIIDIPLDWGISSTFNPNVEENQVKYILNDQIISNHQGSQRKFLVKWKIHHVSNSCWISSFDLHNLAPKLWKDFCVVTMNHLAKLNSSHMGELMGWLNRIMPLLKMM